MAASEAKALKYDRAEEKRRARLGAHYKWIVLSNTTLGALMATIDGSILIISLPAIFNGLGINALAAGDTSLLLWLLLGYTIVSSVTVVAIGRLSDMFGRVRLYNLGFLIFAIASTALYASSYLILGSAGALSMIILRLFQGLGGGLLIANSAAIITDAFPANERGKAMGINQIAAIGGSLVGLLVGGSLAVIDWHLIFLISVPVGIIGTIWAYLALHELALIKKKQRFDIAGNIVFASSVLLILLSLTYGLQPYGTDPTGWTNPAVQLGLLAGILLIPVFIFIEHHAVEPMFRLYLFKIRSFSAGCISLLLSGLARGGLQFMLVIWLQGVWLPLHGINFVDTPIAAAIDMIPLIVGFLVAGPISGYLSDKFDVRIFTTGGMLINTACFLLLATLPVNFSYPVFAVIIFVMSIGQGMFAAPNTVAIMNSVPPEHRGIASGMRATLFNLSSVLSITVFFTLLTLGVSLTLPNALFSGLVAQNVSQTAALQISKLSPATALFAALLGYNPMKVLIPQSVLNAIPSQNASVILGNSFFPNLISQSFLNGMRIVFYLAAAMTFTAAVFSMLRGKRFIYGKK